MALNLTIIYLLFLKKSAKIFTFLIAAILIKTAHFLTLEKQAFDYITPGRLLIVSYWALIGALTIAFSPTKRCIKNTSVRRKYYHFAAAILYAPICVVDPEFLRFAISGLILVFVLIEFARTNYDFWLGRRISLFYKIMHDERDKGKITMVHFYLNFGCFWPVFVGTVFLDCNLSVEDGLIMLSGITSVAVGDAMVII